MVYFPPEDNRLPDLLQVTMGGGNPLAGHLSLRVDSVNTVTLLPTSVVTGLLSLTGIFFPGLETSTRGLRGSVKEERDSC